MKHVFFFLLLSAAALVTQAQVHTNDNLLYNNGSVLYIGNNCLLTVQGDVTTNGVGTVDTQLNNHGFLWVQGNLYGDSAFRQGGNGTVRLQNKTPLYTAYYASENYQVIQGGYRVNGGQSAIGATGDGSFFNLELDNQNGLTFIKSNTDVRGSVDFAPAAVTVDGLNIAPNGTTNRILTYDPGTGAAPVAVPANGANYPATFGMMNNAEGQVNFKHLSTNLTANTTADDNAYIQGKLRRALNSTTGGSYGFPIGLEPSTSSTAARGIQYASMAFTANSYDVLTGYFQQGSDNTMSSPPALVCNLHAPYESYGASNHGEWIFTPATVSTAPYDLTIYPQDFGTVASDGYFITKDDAVPLLGTEACGASPIGISISSITGFSEFGFAGGSSQVLPVTLLSFNGKPEGCNALLEWETNKNAAISQFEIENIKDGRTFRTLAQIDWNKGDSYSYSYAQQSATAFYRIKIKQDNGSFEYSKTINITINCNQESKITIAPNPVTATLNINHMNPGSNKILLSDIVGKIVFTGTASGTTYNLDMQSLASGIYHLKIIDEDGISTVEKIVKN